MIRSFWKLIKTIVSLLVPFIFFNFPLVGQAAVSGPAFSGDILSLAADQKGNVEHVKQGKEKFKADELIVRFRKGIGQGRQQAVHARRGGTSVRTYRKFSDLSVVKIAQGKKLHDVLSEYRTDPDVLYAEPNYIFQAQTTPNDPSFTSLWGLHNAGQTGGIADADINAPEAWIITTGSPDTIVAVIDSGVDYTHPDLAVNMWTNPGEIPGNGIDDDGNGYVDDVHGINAIANSGDPMDDLGHGTHVSGTIAAEGNNSLGVVGVNWSAKVIACKFLDSTGSGYTSDALECLDYLYDLKTRQNNPVNIILSSNSWGGSGYSQALRDAIDLQRQAGMLFVAATGNSAMDTDSFPNYPSGYDLSNIISVAATDAADSLAYFSNYGRHTVHVAAPGVDILSTLPANSYGSYSGTSMATPHVAGLAALLKSQDPSRDWKVIKNLILAGGQDIPAANGKTVTGKRIRAADINGVGSLTCTDQIVFRRMKPSLGTINSGSGKPVDLSVLNINCGVPSGSVVVSTSTGTQILLDDGQGIDQEAGDGIYSGQWTPTGAGEYTLTFPENDQVIVRVVPNYAPAEETTSSYRTILGTQVVFTTGPTATIASPFPIHFAGVSDGYSELKVSYFSGNMSFTDDGVYDWNNAPLPTSLQTQISPYWDDLAIFYGGGIYWDVLGTAPNRELIVEYRNVPHYEYPIGTVTFQTVFFENSSDILFNYQDVTFGDTLYDAGASATVGVQVAPNLAQQFSYNTASLRDGMSLLWRVEGLFADAGPDQFVLPGAAVTLDGNLSSSGSSSIMSYSWSQTGGTPVTLAGADTAEPSFLAPGTYGTLTFQLTVTDSNNETASDSVNIIVNLPPVANAGPDQTVVANSLVTLNGTGSSDPDGTIQSYLWTQTSGTAVVLSGSNTTSPAFTAASAGAALTFRLTVTDSSGQSSTDTVNITVLPPVSGATLAANLTSPQVMGSYVKFTAGGSGGSGNYEYKFLLLKSGVTTTVQTYSSANEWTWNTGSAVPGQYTVIVYVRNVGSGAGYEAQQTLIYSIIETPIFGNITTIAGGGFGDGGQATSALVPYPSGVALDSMGNVYITEGNIARIRRVDAVTGVITVVAGTGTSGYAGDEGPATAAMLNSPSGIALDSAGNIYFADKSNHRIRKINKITGIITTIAGSGTAGYSGDGGLATNARLAYPSGVVVDHLGNLFIADTNNYRIRKVDAATGIISTIAGNGLSGYFGDNGPATSAKLASPMGVAVDTNGDFYIADTFSCRVRKVDGTTGVITTFAGNGTYGYSGDNGPALSASFKTISSVTLDVAGNIYINDSGNNVIRKVSGGTGIVTTVAGGAFSLGDNGPATSANLSSPTGVALDGTGNMYIADYNHHRIRKVDVATSIIITIAGNGKSDQYSGDNVPATSATFYYQEGVAVDTFGNVYIADDLNYRIRKIDAATGVVTTVAGNGISGYAGDDGPAIAASIGRVFNIAIDPSGDLCIADSGNGRIRKVNRNTGIIATVAGNGTSGFSGDNGPATSASFNYPNAVAVDSAGNLYISDNGNYRIRKIDNLTGIITTIAGNGSFGYSGDNGLATGAGMAPGHLAIDELGNIYLLDSGRVRMIDSTTGLIITVAGNGTSGYSGDNGPAIAASFKIPSNIAVDGSGNIYIADKGNNRIRVVDKTTGIIMTAAGNGSAGYAGDNGLATYAKLDGPGGIALDGTGNLYISDTNNVRIRKAVRFDTILLPFSFVDQTDVPLYALMTSNTITVTGIDIAVPIFITGGEYEINNSGLWLDTPSTVYSGDSVRVRVMSSPLYSATTSAVLVIGSVSGTFSVTTIAVPIPDTTPDQFIFTSQTNMAINTLITSDSITVTGINMPAPVTISGGEYELNNSGIWSSTSGTVVNDDTLRVRQMSSINFVTRTDTILTIGGVSGTFNVTTRAADTTPDTFVFIDQTGVSLSTLVTSNTITVAGIEAGVLISISDGEYKINNGLWSSSTGTVNNGDIVSVRQTSSSNFSTKTDTILTIGGMSDTFSVTTLAADTTPAGFTFNDVSNASLSTVYTSNTVTISGINAGSPVSISGGQYSINGGEYTAASGTVNNGDTITVRQTSSGSFATTTDATLMIGGVSDTFRVTTTAQATAPDGDLDGDGVTTVTDALKALRIAAGLDAASAADLAHGDVAPLVNGVPVPDGKIDIGDVVVILRKAVGLVTW